MNTSPQQHNSKLSSYIRYIFYFINIALYITTCLTWIVLPEFSKLNWGLLITSLLLTMVLMYEQRAIIKKYTQSLRFYKLTNSFITVGLVFLIAAIINYLLFKGPKQLDFTQDKQNTLSEQTQNILKKTKGDLSFRVFIRRVDKDQIIPLIELYRFYKGDISVELIDPDLNPAKVNEYGINKYGTVAIFYNNRRVLVHESNEAALTKGILKLIKNTETTIYYTLDHGETFQFLNEDKEQGLSYLKKLLTDSLYNLSPISLTKIESIPANASAIIIWGPKSAFFPEELRKLSAYLARGGRVLIAIDPDFKGYTEESLAAIFRPWGIIFGNNLVIDTQTFVDGSRGTVPISTRYHPTHPITAGFNAPSFYPLTSSIQLSSSTEISKHVKLTPLVMTNNFPDSWIETDLKRALTLNNTFHRDGGIVGPANLAVASESFTDPNATTPAGDHKQTRIVALGNSTLVLNIYQKFHTNFKLILNAVGWLVDEEFTLGNTRADINDTPAFISAQEMTIIFYFSIIIAPLTLMGLAFYFYRRRLKR